MKRITNWGVFGIIEGSLLIVLGLLVAIFGGINGTGFAKTLSYIVAIFLFVDAAIFLLKAIFDVRNWFSPESIIGAFEIAIGVYLVSPEGEGFISEALPIIVGVVLLTIGGATFFKFLLLAKRKAETKMIVVSIIIAIVAITAGVLVLVFKNNGSLPVIFIILGTAIVVAGVFEVCFCATAMKNKKTTAVQNRG